MRWVKRAGLVLALGAAAALVGASTAAANPADVPPWQTFAKFGSNTTGWSQMTSRWTSDILTPEREAGMYLGEPFWDPATSSVAVPWYHMSRGPRSGPSPTFATGVDFRVICEQQSPYALIEQTTGSGSSSSWTSTSDVVRTNLITTQVGGCPTGQKPVGVAAYWKATYGTATIDAARNVWFVGDAFVTSGPAVQTCRQIFGPDYTADSVAMFNGVSTRAGDMGCQGDTLTDPGNPVADAAEAAAVDFAVVCADPPAAEWLSFGWIDDWIGHYASCLVVPSGWDVGGRIDAAYEASPAGPVGVAVDGFGSIGMTDGACGVLGAGTIGGEPLAVSTCDWPVYEGARTIVGLGFLLFAAFCVLTMLVSALGLDFGFPAVSKTLYTGD